MGYILDILILLFFMLFVYKNLRKTQLRVLIESIAYVAAAVIAVPLARLSASLVYVQFFRDAMAKRIETTVSQAAYIQSHTSSLDRIFSQLPSAIRNASQAYGLRNQEIADKVESMLIGNVSLSPPKIVDLLVQPVICGIFCAAFYLLFFWGLVYMLTSLGASVENAVYTPDRAAYNTVLGGVLGGLKGIIIMLLIITFLQFIVPALPLGLRTFSSEQLSQSFLFRLFYDQNAIMLFLGKGYYPSLMA